MAKESESSTPVAPDQGDGAGSTRPLTDAGLGDDLVWAIVEAAPDGIVVADPDGTILLVNQQTEQLFGYDRGELLGRSVDELLPPDARAAHRAHRARYREKPELRPMGIGLELRGVRCDGTEFPVEISLSPLDGAGRPFAIAIVRDITDRVVAEEQNLLIRRTLDATQDGVFIFDADTLCFTYVNDGAIAQVGYTRDELLGMTPADINPHFSEAEIRELLAPLLTGEVSSRTITTSHRRSDGTDIAVELLVQYPPARPGTPRPLVALVRDMTERVQSERRLRHDEERMRTLYRVAAELEAGSQEQFVEALRAATSLLGVEVGVIGRVHDDVIRVEHCWSSLLTIAPGDEFDLPGTYCELTLLAGDVVAIGGPEVAPPDSRPCFVASGIESYVGVPVVVQGQPYGTLSFSAGTSKDEPWSETDRDFVRLIGNWVSRTLERSLTAEELVQARQSLAVTEDRERIARELHDTVIQRLFAAGMGLQGAMQRMADDATRTRLERTVDELDETIREIRSAIFGLQVPQDGGPGLRGDILRIAQGARPALGFTPRIRFNGSIESITNEVAEQLLPSLREALTNVAKHAKASAVRVEVDVTADDGVVLRVLDDGVGIADDVVGGHGLTNLVRRAASLGGTCSVRAADADGDAMGTIVEWRVPGQQASGPDTDDEVSRP